MKNLSLATVAFVVAAVALIFSLVNAYENVAFTSKVKAVPGHIAAFEQRVKSAEHTVGAIPRHRASPWAGLTQAQTIALGDAIRNVPAPAPVMIYCQNSDCIDLQHDIDDALQIPGQTGGQTWKSDFSSAYIEVAEHDGIMLGPNTPQANTLAAAITKATGYKTRIIETVAGQVTVIIGKRPL